MFCTSLRRTRLEVMGARKNGAREGKTPLPSLLNRAARSFLQRYFQAPSTQASVSDGVRALNMERE